MDQIELCRSRGARQPQRKLVSGRDPALVGEAAPWVLCLFFTRHNKHWNNYLSACLLFFFFWIRNGPNLITSKEAVYPQRKFLFGSVPAPAKGHFSGQCQQNSRLSFDPFESHRLNVLDLSFSLDLEWTESGRLCKMDGWLHRNCPGRR